MASFRHSRVRPGPTRLLAAALIASLLALSAPPALAQQSEQEQARDHYKKGLAAYNLGQYSEAAAEFEAAYRLFLDPALLFNIAQANRMNGELEKALNGYRAFLRTAPPATQNRAQAERWRQELEKEVAHAKAAAPATPPPLTASKPTVTAAAPPPAESAPTPAVPVAPAPAGPATGSAPTTLALAAPDPGAPAAMPTLDTTAAARSNESKESSHLWIWGVVGGAVVAGVIAALLLTRSHSSAPDCLGITPCGTLH
jgi:tetratricopeptide (TPR) repeat protein